MMSHGNKQRFGGSSVAPKKMRICKDKLKGGAGKRGGPSQGHVIGQGGKKGKENDDPDEHLVSCPVYCVYYGINISEKQSNRVTRRAGWLGWLPTCLPTYLSYLLVCLLAYSFCKNKGRRAKPGDDCYNACG